MSPKPKIITIVGPTASGKTSLSIAVAKHFNGEVISADSRQVYRGMDLGTGKVTKAEMDGVPHHLLDIADPMTVYTGADFKKDAIVAIDEIVNRHHLPIIAGGTFFYIDLLRGTSVAAPVSPDESFRESLSAYTTEELFDLLSAKDIKRAESIDRHNRRRLIRALEIIETLGTVPEVAPAESTYEWLMIAVDVPQEILHRNIHTRLIDRLALGMVEEVERLHEEGIPWERFHEIGIEYRAIAEFLQKNISHEEMCQQIELKSRQYAKRQLTWLKRDRSIEWFAPENSSAIFRRIKTFLHGDPS